jgi:hypothetical protein
MPFLINRCQKPLHYTDESTQCNNRWASGVYQAIAYFVAAKTIAKSMAPKAAPGVGNAGATEARRLAEMKQRTDPSWLLHLHHQCRITTK